MPTRRRPKGRVERRFKTFQDRVIKEVRLADVSTWTRRIGLDAFPANR